MMLSKTKLMTFIECPALFKLRYIDRVETPPNIWLETGKKVHDFHEWFWQNVKVNGGIKLELPFFNTEYTTKKYIDNIMKAEGERLKTLVSLGKKDFFRPFVVEEEYKFEHKDFHIHGFIDRIDVLDDKLTLIELKTNRYPAMTRKMILELSFYKYLFENSTNRKIHDGLFYFPVDNSFHTVDFLKNTETENIIKKVSDLIDKGDFSHKDGCSCEIDSKKYNV